VWALQQYPRYRREYPRIMCRPEYAHVQIIQFHSPIQATHWLLAVSR
jgi:hypothetical protein